MRKATSRSKGDDGYRERDINLKSLGHKDYAGYLRSSTWADIRKRVLKRDGYKCRICGNPSMAVHHSSYALDVLSGANDAPLLSVCSACHLTIEFKKNGKKYPFSDVVKRTQALLAGSLKPRHKRPALPREDSTEISVKEKSNNVIAVTFSGRGRRKTVHLHPCDVDLLCAILEPYRPIVSPPWSPSGTEIA